MKLLTVTTEKRAYTEEEAKQGVLDFQKKANEEGYIVKTAGYTYKPKKKKGEVIAEAWIVKCTGIYNEVWEEDEI